MTDALREQYFDNAATQLKVVSARQVLLRLAQMAGDFLHTPPTEIYDALCAQNMHKAAGVGDGVAVLHLILRRTPCALRFLTTLERPVDFNAADGQLVDTVAFLITPEDETNLHLRRISRLSRLLKNPLLKQRINETRDPQALRSLLMDPEGWLLAA